MSDRGNFSGRIGFILAATGSAIGLSNIWRFPYLAGQNGGAVFVIIYLLCIFIFCFPVMIGEISIGRAAGRDAYGSYTRLGNKKWGLLGLTGIVSSVIILSYYNVVAGWAFGFFVEIAFNNLLLKKDFSSFFGNFVNNISANLFYSFIFLLLTSLSVIGGIQKGIERANRILMPALFLVLLGLIGYSLTLPHAMEGIRFYLIPDFSKITAQTIFDALRLSFFTLSLGVGGLITYGSYVKKSENIVYAASVVTWADTVVAFLAGLMIFPLVFSAGQSPAEGPPLVFIVLPQIFQDMGPVVGKLMGSTFFLLLCFAALPSCISLMENPVAYFVDEKKYQRKNVVIILTAVVFIIGLPSLMSFGAVPFLNQLPFYKNRDFLTFVADVTDITLTIGGCLMCIFITYKWKIHNMNAELATGNSNFMGTLTQRYINFTIVYVCPLLLGVLSILVIIDKFFGLFS
ncbi:sodium-dependent transporter [Chryseosolibacter indicus]|uniref:Transporter n=1 Tax=Chryseosolibacter indicus TaxID=2782351 RepID=A0ABS5VTI3_9BACT|nr:sodium-dependent transporter [Chryseosolibacter indicus]MBT1703291.1 sodium-dependent transporter [Chryseosolibacter indicus]